MEAAWQSSDAEAAAGPPAARGAGRRRRRRRRLPRPPVGGAARRQARAPATAASTTSPSTCASTTTPTRSRAGPAARPQRPLPDRVDRGGAGAGHRRARARSSRRSRQAQGTATSTPGSAPRTTRCGSRPTWSWIDQTHPRHRPRDARRRTQSMSVLAIDAGTTGVTAVVVTDDGRDRGQGLPGVPPALPPARLGRARPRGDLAGHARGDPRGPDAGRRRRAAGGRHHQPARDRHAVGPRDARLAPRRAIVWQDRRTADICTRLRDAGPRGAGHRADRAAPRPLLLRHQADVAGRERAAHVGAGGVGPVRRRHRRLLPDRPDDPRHLPRHRRLQRLPDAAASTSTTGDWSDELCALFGVPRDALPELVPNWGEVATTDPASFLDLSLPIAGHRRRPAVGTLRADLLRRGRLQVHLRHRLVHPHQHRHLAGALATPGCCPPPPGAPPTAS